MTERKYLPTLAELLDRLSIVQLKMIFIPENREAYKAERALIEHDIDCTFGATFPPGIPAKQIRAIMMIMLANHFIWSNESQAREGGHESDQMLRATHSVNGVRAAAKNKIAAWAGERVDLKVDCLAGDLQKEFGNWNVFDD